MTTIAAIEGIGPSVQQKLRTVGVRTCEGLLEQGATKKGRRALAESSGINEKRLLEWVNRADLMRIKGVSTQYSDLLEAAGVDTVKELRRRKAENLAVAMLAANEAGARRLVRRPPSTKVVSGWVEQAKHLPPAVTH